MKELTLRQIPRPEHPRPDFMRDTFHNLNAYGNLLLTMRI